MNISMILYFLGWVLKIEGILMILPCAIALIYQELNGLYFLGIGLFCVISGWLMSRKKPSNTVFHSISAERFRCLRMPFSRLFPASPPQEPVFFPM